MVNCDYYQLSEYMRRGELCSGEPCSPHSHLFELNRCLFWAIFGKSERAFDGAHIGPFRFLERNNDAADRGLRVFITNPRRDRLYLVERFWHNGRRMNAEAIRYIASMLQGRSRHPGLRP